MGECTSLVFIGERGNNGKMYNPR
jgi:hypothetical protein